MIHERRIAHRFALQIPIEIVCSGMDLKIQGKTRDVGAGGLFLYADAPVFKNEEINLFFTLPLQGNMVPVRVACRARILRVEYDEVSDQKGIAVAIQKFDFLTETDLALSSQAHSGL